MLDALKIKNEGKIMFVKTGAFYVAVAEDAIWLHENLKLKCTCFKEHICKVGVPIASIEKYLEKLDKLGTSYIVYSFNKEKAELKIEYEKAGKRHKEKRYNCNCLYCKGVNKYKENDEYMEAVIKLYGEE